MKKTPYTLLLIPALLLLAAWGSTGHYKISFASGLTLNPAMTAFTDWAAYLADHASDADDRKATDPAESVRHYIDIDSYPEFIANGAIATSYQTNVALHGYTYVRDHGTLPWTTLWTVDSLESCFRRGDFTKARYFASDLGHYVADGHMPLHITENYDGQYTNNSGIHSRYESTMINGHISQIVYDGWPPQVVDDVGGYIFNYIYHNQQYVDSVLQADDYAKSINSNTSSSAYKNALWAKTGNFTTELFKNASHTLGELIYTAWVKAGSPDPGSFGFDFLEAMSDYFQVSVYPNPLTTSAKVEYYMPEDAHLSVMLCSIEGKPLQGLLDSKIKKGFQQLTLNRNNLPAGIYLLLFRSNGSRQAVKVVVQ